MSRQLVMTLFEQQFGMESALDALREQGFRGSQISAAFLQPGEAALSGPISWLLDSAEGTQLPLHAGSLFAAGPILAGLDSTLRDPREMITHALSAFGVASFDSDFYGLCVSAGKCFVAVHAENPARGEQAQRILDSAQGQGTLVISEDEHFMPPPEALGAQAPGDLRWPW